MMPIFQLFLYCKRAMFAKIRQISAISKKFTEYMSSRLCFLLILSLIGTSEALSSNFLIEYEFSESLIKQVDAEEIVWLETGIKRKTFALFTDAENIDIQGGAIILSDFNQHPDWPQITRQLRKALPRFGWQTLSIQMPIIENHPTNIELERQYNAVGSRIQAGIDHFKEKGVQNIVLIGRSQTANIAIRYTAEISQQIQDEENPEESAIQALVCISAFDSPWLNVSESIRQIPIAILDIFGENDIPEVLMSAKKRLIASQFSAKLKHRPTTLPSSRKVQKLAINKTGNLRYRQAVIAGADHQFTRQDRELVKYIRGWLGIYAAGEEVESQ